MSQTFCMLAWKHLQINPEGTAKICCRANASITDNDGRPLSLYEHSVENIWNSEYMQNVRRTMVLGEKVPACQGCYNDEARTGVSYRTQSNDKWLNTFSTTIETEKERAIAASFIEEDDPVYIQFNMGNLCNLKCRMCNSTYSSKIEGDPVHSKWSPHLEFLSASLLSWSDDNTVVIAPHPLKGVEYRGFRDFAMLEGRPLRWTEGDGCIDLKLPAGTKLRSMVLKLWHFSGPDGSLKVMVNDETVFDGIPPRGRWMHEFELTSIAVDEKLQIRIISPTFSTHRDSNLGVAVEEIKLCREYEEKRKKSPNIVFNRFDDDVFWFEDDSLVFGEFLGNFETLQEIYFTGGEPLIHPRVEAVIDFLIEKKVAKNVTLQFNSNCTNVKDDFLTKLSQFRQVDFALSVDGMGADYEYIRYPSRWSNVSKNVLKLKELPNANLRAVPMVQIYNVLNIVNFCRFCDDVGIKFGLMILHGPLQLSVLVMPSQARQLAASRLREYANNDCFEHNKSTVLAMVQYLESGPDWCNTEMFKQFMLFTNDLDASRQQSFLETYPRLVSLFEEAGFTWSLERMYSEQLPQKIHS